MWDIFDVFQAFLLNNSETNTEFLKYQKESSVAQPFIRGSFMHMVQILWLLLFYLLLSLSKPVILKQVEVKNFAHDNFLFMKFIKSQKYLNAWFFSHSADQTWEWDITRDNLWVGYVIFLFIWNLLKVPDHLFLSELI